MKVLVGGVGVVVGVPAFVFLVGAALPVEHVARASANYDREAEAVWRAITDVDAFPEWRSDVTRVEVQSNVPGLRTWTERGPSGEIPFVVEAWEPPRRLVTRIAGEGLPFGGRWTYTVEPVGGDGARHSRLTIVEHGEVYNPVFRFVSRFVMGHTATMEAYLEALAARLGTTAADSSD